MDNKPRVVVQQSDESLADCACGPDDADLDGRGVDQRVAARRGGHLRGREVGRG